MGLSLLGRVTVVVGTFLWGVDSAMWIGVLFGRVWVGLQGMLRAMLSFRIRAGLVGVMHRIAGSVSFVSDGVVDVFERFCKRDCFLYILNGVCCS